MNTTLKTFLLCAAFASAGCHAGAGAADAPESKAEKPAAAKGSHVVLEEGQLSQIRIEALSAQSPEDAIKATGTVEFNADRMARILPPLPGQVHDLDINVGDNVDKDSVLFVLSSRDVTAALTEHVASHKDLDLADKTYRMTKDLYEHQAASHMALQQSESELDKAKAHVLQTEEVLQVLGLESHAGDDAAHVQSRIPVRTPIGGTVIERSVTNGQFVSPDNPALITIADLSNVWVQADVFERDVHSIAVGQKADVTATAYPDEHFFAHVSRIGNVVDPQTRTAKVRVLVSNRDFRLKPGMSTSVSLVVPNGDSSLTVPAKAVFVENSKSFAYVQVGDREFARRDVETVARGSDRLRVVRGLSAGDRVVSDGVLLLRQLETDTPQ
jgi:cobalt-zinc-cadmium efflux system membrane fusion protein